MFNAKLRSQLKDMDRAALRGYGVVRRLIIAILQWIYGRGPQHQPHLLQETLSGRRSPAMIVSRNFSWVGSHSTDYTGRGEVYHSASHCSSRCNGRIGRVWVYYTQVSSAFGRTVRCGMRVARVHVLGFLNARIEGKSERKWHHIPDFADSAIIVDSVTV